MITMTQTKETQTSMPALLLRAEGAAAAFAAIAFYIHIGGSGLLFVLLILAPDLSALGYIKNPVVGSVVYNTVHTYAMPIILAVIALAVGSQLALSIALIWFTHIGIDRLMGFGLKYPTQFKDTHLQHV
jgi:hypothetical protein